MCREAVKLSDWTICAGRKRQWCARFPNFYSSKIQIAAGGGCEPEWKGKPTVRRMPASTGGIHRAWRAGDFSG